jgi:hypothetical protein
VKLSRRAVLAFAAVAVSSQSFAHPLPDTQILIEVTGRTLHLTIDLPLHELKLALPNKMRTSLENQKDLLREYFASHLKITSSARVDYECVFESFSTEPAFNDHVGSYELLRVIAHIPQQHQNFILHYDAIMHQVPNHKASVTWSGKTIGVIAFDLKTKRTPPMLVDLSA